MSDNKHTERTKNAKMTGDLEKETKLTITLTENTLTNKIHAYGFFSDTESAEDHLALYATTIIHTIVEHAKPDGKPHANLTLNENRWIIVIKDLQSTKTTVKGFFKSSKSANAHIRLMMSTIDKSIYHAIYVLPVLAYNQITVRG